MVRVEELDVLVGARGISKTIAQLDRLSEKLLDVAEAQQLVSSRTIDLDVRDGEVDAALAKVGTLGATTAATGAGPSGARASGGTATDGAGGGTGGLSPERLQRMMDDFGDAFDADAIVRSGGILGDDFDALEGDITDHIDSDRLLRSVADGALPRQATRRTWMRNNLGRLRGMGITNLPEDRGFIGQFRQFASNIDATSINNLFARLMPMLATFIGALPAAIAGVVALGGAALGAAGALAGVAGLGALGMAMDSEGNLQLEELTDTISNVVDDFLAAFGPLANQLQPLFERGLDGLRRFFDALAARGDVLTAFADEAIAFGQWLSRGLVNVLTVFTQLADASSDAFGAIAEGLDAEDTAEFFAMVIAETLPALARFVGAIRDIMPAVIRLSAGFLTATAVTIQLIEVLGSLIGTIITVFGIIPLDVIGVIIGLLLTLTTVVALLSSYLMYLYTVWTARIIPAIMTAITQLHGYIAAAIGATAATVALTAAAAALLAVLTLGVAPVLTSIGSQIGGLGGKFQKAAKDLERFNAQGTTAGGFGTGSGGSDSAYIDVTNNTSVESTGNQREDNRLARKAAYSNQQVTDYNLSQ